MKTKQSNRKIRINKLSLLANSGVFSKRNIFSKTFNWEKKAKESVLKDFGCMKVTTKAQSSDDLAL